MPPSALSPIRFAAAGLIAMLAGMGIARFVYTPILPAMMAELGLSASEAGLIASANFVGYLAGALLASGSWGQGVERPVAIGGVGVSALLLAAMAATDSLAAFLVIRFVAGVASAFVMVFMSTIVFSNLAALGRPGLQAAHFAGVGIGIAVSALATGASVLMDWDWRSGWVVSAAVAAVSFVAVAILTDRGPAAHGGPAREPALPRSPALRRIILAYGIFGVGYIVTATFLVAIVRESDGGRLFESAVWLAAGIAVIPSLWIWDRIARRRGPGAVFVQGCIVLAAGIAASVLLPLPYGPLIGGVLFGGTFVAVTAYGLQIGRRLAGASPRRSLALMTASFGIGQILGPIAAGYAADWSGSFAAPSIAAALALLAAALCARNTDRGS